MSSIKIKTISITELETDAVVNAANEGLWAGGGVCGAIFKAAGHRQLQNACDKIGHCDTGSAVITPGFQLKAKYIIHAVGPRWMGGNHHEAELLYGAYKSSLELAAKNGCASIGFPLISAGIFGYPLQQAWEIAYKACREFLDKGYEMEIVFAVLNNGARKEGQNIFDKFEIVSGEPAKGEDLDNNVGEIIGFHLPEEPHGCFSNWCSSKFTYAGEQYNCVEQYMMAQKVALGGRYDLMHQIMMSSDPETIKDLGGKKYFTEFAAIKTIWDKHCKHIVKRGVKAKFMQNPQMLKELMNTGNALLAECARSDKIWGIGINLNDPTWKNVSNWNGSNYLGRILMEIREELGRELKQKKSVQYVDYRYAKPISEWKMQILHLKLIPQYYSAIHTYADQIPKGHARVKLYECTFEEIEEKLSSHKNGGFPVAGFYEMKQEIYEIAHGLKE